MDLLPEMYADTMGEITLSGGMVRIDLVSLTGFQNKDGQQPKLEPRMRVVMSPDGFLRSYKAMDSLVKQLVDAGLVKPRSQGEAGAGDADGGENF